MSAPAELIAALPQYDIGAEIGEGGMGVVFAGVHRTLGRSVAIKQLPWDVLNHATSSELFDREARVLASLDHPHIVPVYDYVRTGREHLLVMERLDGGTVHSRFHGDGVSGEQACAIGLAMLAGLHAAHLAGVLHLDVKPRNLLFSTQGVVKVADFGIARVISEGATLVTHGGEILGTPAYIAPEQAMGNALSPAADVYAAGTVLYELLSGRLPFDNTRGAISMMRQHMFTDPMPIAGVPMPIAGVVMRSLARELDSRYREAESFAADLAAAATAVYGPGWLERSGVPVLHLPPRVIAGLNAPTAPASPVAGLGAAALDPARTRPVQRPGAPNPTLAAPHPHLDPNLTGGTSAQPPENSAAPVIWLRVGAALAALALIILALLNPERLPHSASPTLNLGGTAVSAPVEVDLSKPLIFSGPGNPGPVAIDLSAAGIPLGSAETTAKPEGNGFTAELTLPGIARWIVGGAVTATVRTGPITQTFTLLTSQHPLASAMGAGSLILALFALAYLESGLRTIRNGHRWRGAPVGGPVLGILFGAAVWLCVSVLRLHEPSPGFGAGCAVAGALAAGLVVAAARRRASTVRLIRPSAAT
ncbi:serine/threonine-protein kinase [Amycolatopsis sp. SID8362]|uniref:serine/threonine-protein kinase n=1 Tax=Amycolatopsis sp. SID8362 TaxID=2690346 RepID=UPI00136E1473|nr:serine/threonine-protein kinase [Amycolatopsis sp. SID8362]NBH05139.1 protein kinase [Amycolatopsis sp. SID8362]NED41839.1 serine/threonine protein kinase [Amycolatopsis sp. SID8362]